MNILLLLGSLLIFSVACLLAYQGADGEIMALILCFVMNGIFLLVLQLAVDAIAFSGWALFGFTIGIGLLQYTFFLKRVIQKERMDS